MAEGAEVPMLHVFLRNIEGALLFAQRQSEDASEGGESGAVGAAEHCTDYMVGGEGFLAWGHNEDGPSTDRHFHYVVHQTVTGEPAAQFTAYAYAGMLPGWAWGFNSKLGFSINALAPPPPAASGGAEYISIEFVTREVLGCQTIDDALSCATVPQALGASYNMGEWDTGRLVNFEVAPGDAAGRARSNLVEVGACDNGVHVHANLYRRLEVPGELRLSSTMRRDSESRVARGYELQAARDVGGVLEVLGSEAGEFPIFHARTLASIVFDLEARACKVWTGRPQGKAEMPDLVLEWERAGEPEDSL